MLIITPQLRHCTPDVIPDQTFKNIGIERRLFVFHTHLTFAGTGGFLFICQFCFQQVCDSFPGESVNEITVPLWLPGDIWLYAGSLVVTRAARQ